MRQHGYGSQPQRPKPDPAKLGSTGAENAADIIDWLGKQLAAASAGDVADVLFRLIGQNDDALSAVRILAARLEVLRDRAKRDRMPELSRL